jgi:hypothetical protein
LPACTVQSTPRSLKVVLLPSKNTALTHRKLALRHSTPERDALGKPDPLMCTTAAKSSR